MEALTSQEMFEASMALRAAGDVSRNLRTGPSQAGHLLNALAASGRSVSIVWDDADDWTVAVRAPEIGDVDFVESHESLARALHAVIMELLRVDKAARSPSTERGV